MTKLAHPEMRALMGPEKLGMHVYQCAQKLSLSQCVQNYIFFR